MRMAHVQRRQLRNTVSGKKDRIGVAAGAIGSALADLTSYPAYTLPTLIIKSLIPLFGYTLTGGILYGNMLTGLAQFPGLLLEYIANAILFTVAYPVAKKIKSPLE